MIQFKKVAIPNRGEIAVRIIKALKELNISSVLLYAFEDKGSLAYRLADETLCIGGGSVQENYLNIPAVINGVLSAGADALHPGVGFLSENFLLAQSCEENNITFIGPSIECIQLFGNKLSALKHIHSLGVPALPSYFGNDQEDATLIKEARRVGYPLLIKLATGGGGVGIKKVLREEDFLTTLKSVQNLGQSVFNSSKVYLEKFLENAQHIEVQVFGDSKGNIQHLYGRNCSIQKRNQKVIEESLFGIHKNLELNIYQKAIDIARSVHYRNAGTVEFLLKDDEFYFLEMNTRLQVEHPVTELWLNVDLVQAQIIEAMGGIPLKKFTPQGHVLECRINSQDFETDRPVSGDFGTIQWAPTSQSRWDAGYESYDKLPSSYDALIGKAIVRGETRAQCIEKMKYILENSIIFGIPTNQEELLNILNHPSFVENKFHTEFLVKTNPLQLTEQEQELIQYQCSLINSKTSKEFNPWTHRWSH